MNIKCLSILIPEDPVALGEPVGPLPGPEMPVTPVVPVDPVTDPGNPVNNEYQSNAH